MPETDTLQQAMKFMVGLEKQLESNNWALNRLADSTSRNTTTMIACTAVLLVVATVLTALVMFSEMM